MKCTAVLEDHRGKFIEKGMVSIPEDSLALDFTSDFLPLFKLGTPLTVIPVANNEPLDGIRGEVFLSTSTFLRLTNLQERELRELKELLKSNISMQLDLHLCPFAHLPFLIKKAEKINAQIYYLDSKTLKFYTEDPLDIGQKLLLETEDPLTLKKLVVQVDEVLCISNTGLNYICIYINLSPENAESILNYINPKAEP